MSLDLIKFVKAELNKRKDPQRAEKMAAYMKTDMFFYGVGSDARKEVFKAIKKNFKFNTFTEHQKAVLVLWEQDSREEKYLAVSLAQAHRDYIRFSALKNYRKMIIEGAWWDFVDELAIHLVGALLAKEPDKMYPVMDKWIEDKNMWIRRSAILSQNRFKDKTDETRLYSYCLKCAAENDFFIRKAIGWSLREYSKTAPTSVKKFLQENEHLFSGLSLREGARILKKNGQW